MFAGFVADLRSRQVTPVLPNGNKMFALLFKQESRALSWRKCVRFVDFWGMTFFV